VDIVTLIIKNIIPLLSWLGSDPASPRSLADTEEEKNLLSYEGKLKAWKCAVGHPPTNRSASPELVENLARLAKAIDNYMVNS
jgi:hypothetical protein